MASRYHSGGQTESNWGLQLYRFKNGITLENEPIECYTSLLGSHPATLEENLLAFQALAPTPDPQTVNSNGPLALTLLLGAILAGPISAGLIWLYRRAVRKSMSSRKTPLKKTEQPSASVPPVGFPENVPVFPPVEYTSSTPLTTSARELYGRLLHGPWRVAAIYVLGGFCFAVIMTVANLAGEQFSPLRVLVLFWVSAWPIVLTINLIANAGRLQKFLTVLVYFLVFVVIEAVMIISGAAPAWPAPMLWLLLNLPATLLLLAFLSRRVRAVGPLVLIFLITALAGPQLIVLIANDRFLSLLIALGEPFGLGHTAILAALVFFGFVLTGPIGWLTLRWIRSRYERKKISDESITLDAIWLLFGLVQALVLSSRGVEWLLSGMLAFAVYKLVTRSGLALIKRKPENVKLLLLRRFSLGKESRRLFDALAKHWRHAGSIQLIAGVDLAQDNLEPHEFLDFLSGKLARRFIDTPEALETRLVQMDCEPDQDGRFRVNEFFCHDDTWRNVLSRLVRESNVILMDLRGFTDQDKGCLYEIRELINLVSLAQVQFIVDEKTESALLGCMRTSWNSLSSTSPNRLEPATLRLLRFKGSSGAELRKLLRSVSVAATAA